MPKQTHRSVRENIDYEGGYRADHSYLPSDPPHATNWTVWHDLYGQSCGTVGVYGAYPTLAEAEAAMDRHEATKHPKEA